MSEKLQQDIFRAGRLACMLLGVILLPVVMMWGMNHGTFSGEATWTQFLNKIMFYFPFMCLGAGLQAGSFNKAGELKAALIVLCLPLLHATFIGILKLCVG